MSDPVFFGRLGEIRRFRFLDAFCLGCACFAPLVLIEKRTAGGDREHAGCRTMMTASCPSLFQRGYTDAREDQRRKDGWVSR